MNKIIDYISERRSIVSFSQKPVEAEKIKLLFEAANLAPSSMNAQPWRYVYATRENKEEFTRFFDCLNEGNKRWVQNVPLLVLSVAETISSIKNTYNRFAWHDVGLANSLLMIQAVSMGLHSHPMGGFDADKIKIYLGIQPPFEPVAMIAIGYKDENTSLPDDLVKRESQPRIRKSLDEFVLSGRFKM